MPCKSNEFILSRRDRKKLILEEHCLALVGGVRGLASTCLNLTF